MGVKFDTHIFLIFLLTAHFSCVNKKRKETVSKRVVKNNILISNSNLKKTFQISEDLTFLADSAFVLKERSNTEVFLFTDSKKGEIKRFLQFQFESFVPEIEGTYKFHDVKDSIQVDGLQLLQSHWCFDLMEAAKEMPKSDISVVQKVLNDRGVTTTGIYVGRRYIYLSKDKRFEMLIIYGEKDSYRGIDCSNEETALPLLLEMDEQILNSFDIQNNH
jgi:hypothetical protein